MWNLKINMYKIFAPSQPISNQFLLPCFSTVNGTPVLKPEPRSYAYSLPYSQPSLSNQAPPRTVSPPKHFQPALFIQAFLPEVSENQIGPGLRSLLCQSILDTIVRVNFPRHKSDIIEKHNAKFQHV